MILTHLEGGWYSSISKAIQGQVEAFWADWDHVEYLTPVNEINSLFLIRFPSDKTKMFRSIFFCKLHLHVLKSI